MAAMFLLRPKTICCYSSQLQTIGVPMSNEQTAARHSALTLAVQFADVDVGESGVVRIAETFLSFLNRGDDASTSASAKTSPSSAPATKGAPPSDTKTA